MTLKELSALLNLSPTTVSRALNGYPEVGAATRARIEEAARAHGYRPNAQARHLATGRAMAIGHVVPLSSAQPGPTPAFTDFLAAAGEVYAAHGFDLLMNMVPADQEEAAYRSLQARGAVDGVILHDARENDPRPALMRALGLPFVMQGRPGGAPSDSPTDLPMTGDDPSSPPWPAHVEVDHAGCVMRAVAHLAALGHRRIALVDGPLSLAATCRRRDAFRHALARHGLEAPAHRWIFGDLTEAQGHDAAREMLTWGATAPTAFVAGSLIVATGLGRGIAERGLRLGRDISVVAQDDDLEFFANDRRNPVFTTLRVPIREVGRRAAEALMARILSLPRPAGGPIAPQLIDGASCGPCPPEPPEASPQRPWSGPKVDIPLVAGRHTGPTGAAFTS